MTFSANQTGVLQMAEAMDEGASLYGVNANTAQMDSRAWIMWEAVCETHGNSPCRSSRNARECQERNTHLLAALMMHALALCPPKANSYRFIEPRSAGIPSGYNAGVWQVGGGNASIQAPSGRQGESFAPLHLVSRAPLASASPRLAHEFL